MFDIEPSSGNVFADLDLPDADERQLLVKLAVELNAFIHNRNLTQAAAAAMLQLPESKVTEIHNYKLADFSSVQLLSCLKCFYSEQTSKPNARIGTNFEDYLRDEGVLNTATTYAYQRVDQWLAG